MKSPNAKHSLDLLKMAKKLTRVAYEDLKTSGTLRDNGTTSSLIEIEKQLTLIIEHLKTLGYE